MRSVMEIKSVFYSFLLTAQ